MESASQNVAFQYGVLGVIALVFAYAIIALFRRSDARDAKIAEERAAWAAKEQTIRTEYEAKIAAAITAYAKELEALRLASQAREDLIRKEYADLMERSAEESTKAAQATTEVLSKVYERFLGPRIGPRT